MTRALVATLMMLSLPAWAVEPPALIPRAMIELPALEGIGGLSGLAVDCAGDALVAVTDRGDLVTAGLVRGDDGRLDDLAGLVVRRLGGLEDIRSKVNRDAEALAIAADGGWLVALETRNVLLHYTAGLAGLLLPPVTLTVPAALSALPGNAGIEAMTTLADGTLLAIAEREDAAGGHPAWAVIGGAWHELSYATDPGYRVVDAAALPDGRALVLERHPAALGLLAARLVLLSLDRASLVLEAMPVGRVATPVATDNYEGLALCPGSTAEITAYLIADDNFSMLQRNVLIELELPPLPLP